jgi:ribosomal RNA-processing protein 8
MREKLVSARFRHLNETLYTRPSEESFSLFQDSPEMFTEYHEGFRRQVKVWPENPVDSFLSDIRARAKARPPMKGRPGPGPSQRNKMALPRTVGTCTIADLGCGDARLAESLQTDKAKLRLDVKSFDLQSPSPLVTKADIANLPLEDGSVNVAIFCLALMGTNWIDFVEEAYRILHWKGELWIAEIKSRFGPVRKSNVVEHSVGNRKKNNVALSKKAKATRDAEADAIHGADLAVEVDGLEDKRRETDVTAFIEALQKRGFMLQGERAEAVDLGNRMFVKMHFTKSASPTKGKGVKAEDAAKMGANKKKRGFTTKWDEDEGAEKGQDEASILKPCVYKIR